MFKSLIRTEHLKVSIHSVYLPLFLYPLSFFSFVIKKSIYISTTLQRPVKVYIGFLFSQQLVLGLLQLKNTISLFLITTICNDCTWRFLEYIVFWVLYAFFSKLQIVNTNICTSEVLNFLCLKKHVLSKHIAFKVVENYFYGSQINVL